MKKLLEDIFGAAALMLSLYLILMWGYVLGGVL